MVDWIMKVPSLVFNRILTDFSQDMKTKYAMTRDNFSSVSSNSKDPVFPFVFVHLLSVAEQGTDLERTSINVARFTFQIDVYDNKSQIRARNVMGEIARIMRLMRFTVAETPELEGTDEQHRCTLRFGRNIGEYDILVS